MTPIVAAGTIDVAKPMSASKKAFSVTVITSLHNTNR